MVVSAHQRLSPQEPNGRLDTSLEQPHGRAANEHHAGGHAGDHDDRPHRGGARAEPLVVPTKPSSLGTHGANLSMGVVELRHEIGARVRALADQYSAVSATRGIDVTALAAHVAATGSVVGRPDTESIELDTRCLLST